MREALSVTDRAHWFAVQVWAGRERLAARHLLMRGYEVFLPSYREWHQWSDRRQSVEHALFSGYLFCRTVPDVVAKIVTTPGVICVVGDGCGPLPVPVDEIDTLQRVIAAGLTARPWEFLQPDEPVQVIDGPLCGTQGVFVKAKNQDRLIISVSLLKRSVAVEIDPGWVQALPRRSRGDRGFSVPVFDGTNTAATV